MNMYTNRAWTQPKRTSASLSVFSITLLTADSKRKQWRLTVNAPETTQLTFLLRADAYAVAPLHKSLHWHRVRNIMRRFVASTRNTKEAYGSDKWTLPLIPHTSLSFRMQLQPWISGFDMNFVHAALAWHWRLNTNGNEKKKNSKRLLFTFPRSSPYRVEARSLPKM